MFSLTRHEFHKNCIDPWLIEHRTCPMCKLDVLKFYGYVVGDEIHTTPTPRHMAANNTAPLDDTDVPVVVVGVVPRASNANSSLQPPSQSSSSLSSSSSATSATATALAALNSNSNNIPSRFSATQASVETQTITTIEPHSSREDIETHLQNYHRTAQPPLPQPPASSIATALAVDAVDGSYNYNLNSSSSHSSNHLVSSNNSQAWSLSFPLAQQPTQVNTGSHLVTDV